MKKLFRTDTKPNNYSYLTFCIISSLSHDGKIEFMKNLEKLLLKSVIHNSPDEIPVELKNVRTFHGKKLSSVISVWFSQIARQKKISTFLFKINRFRLN